MQQRNEAKLKENLKDIVNTVKSDSDWIQSHLQPLLIPIFSGMTVFLGFYYVGRRQAFKKHLSDLIRERHKQFPDDPIIASMVSTPASQYKPLSAIKVK